MNTVLAFTPDLVRLYFTPRASAGTGCLMLHRKLATLREFAKWGLRHKPLGPLIRRGTSRTSSGRRICRARSPDDEVARLLALLTSPPMEHVLRPCCSSTRAFGRARLTALRVGDLNPGPAAASPVISTKAPKPHTVEPLQPET